MTTTDHTADLATGSLLPGAVIIARIRRLLVASIVAGILYSTITHASKSGCPGGVDANGNFIDASGNPTDIPPECVSLTLGPSPVILILMGVIVLWALGRVLRRAESEAAALRILDRAALAVGILAAVSVVVAQVWFALIPLGGIDGSGSYIWPFPFGVVDMQTMPMER